MYRLFIITISILYSCFALAKSTYQVDLIVFAHPKNANKSTALDLNSALIPINKNAISLKSDSNKSYPTYSLLPSSQSSLANEYYLLSRKSANQVLGHYSWKQSTANQSMVALPKLSHNGWQMQGTLHIQQGSYYQFNTDLQFSPPYNPNASFTVSQKQRLKNGVVYYLDHPQIGMLVKIHQIA